MRKILFIIQNLGGGGAERVLINILNNLDYCKYKVDLLLIHKSGVYLNKINKNVKIKYILPSNKNETIFNRLHRSLSYKMYNYYPKLCTKVFINKKYDVEIAFLEGASTKFLSFSHNKHSKKIAWVHIDIIKHRTMPIEEEREIYRHIDEIICVSYESEKQFINLYPEYKHKVKVIYNLIDREEILSLSNEKLDIKLEGNVIVAVGRLSKQKRFDVLIKAHTLLINEGVNNKLIILGEGEQRSELNNLIQELSAQDSVLMPGFVENPYPYIKNCTVFAMSSDYEGFSLVVAEAMTLGKAIVSTNCTGPAELLEYGKNGILVETNDPYKLKDALKSLLTDKKLRRKFERSVFENNKVDNVAILKKINRALNA